MAPPPCRRLGRQCRSLDVTIRVAALEGEEDHDATWFFGHTERLDFGRSYTENGELWSETTIHVPCKYLELDPDGRTAACRAHGFNGRVPAPKRTPAPRRLGRDRFRIVENRRLVTRHLPPPTPVKRSLPLAPDTNPCAKAPCRTADHTRHAACCRDLNVEIRCGTPDTMLEALLRSRKSPYLCKVERDESEEGLVTAEIISACAFLKEDGLHCDLHGRTRTNGEPGKPRMCSHWPEKRTGLHPGCAFRNRRLPL
ncbi:MAG: hypothetical protein V4503_10245 [Gemmatimonadota bacterium]